MMEVKSVEEYMERIRVLDALEQQAMGLSRMLTTYTDRLQERLEQRVEIEKASEEAVLTSIKSLEAVVDKSVHQKRQLVEQCQQLDSEMKETREILQQVREIKQLLDVMEYAKRKS
ncbi:hypothetical protein H4217_002607 [Coemansia sp. RSA 1939]|nr:hypothetical protein H4217_002607 [Coemansia sp. RSA 1939]KAJ2694650.1 hypothetical protein GGH99_000574 [Coemansia sp. RSA 1285]